MISGVTGRCIEPGYANVPKLNGGGDSTGTSQEEKVQYS